MEHGLMLGSGSLGVLFGLAAVAAMVIFIVYAAEWASDEGSGTPTFTDTNADHANDYIRAEFAYYAFVIAALSLLTGMHGYVVAREML